MCKVKGTLKYTCPALARNS